METECTHTTSGFHVLKLLSCFSPAVICVRRRASMSHCRDPPKQTLLYSKHLLNSTTYSDGLQESFQVDFFHTNESVYGLKSTSTPHKLTEIPLASVCSRNLPFIALIVSLIHVCVCLHTQTDTHN